MRLYYLTIDIATISVFRLSKISETKSQIKNYK